MSPKHQVYKLITPSGESLHEVDEIDGKILIPSAIFRRSAIWRLFNRRIVIKRLVGGKWEIIFNNRGRELRQRIK